ncbi:helix-hairpin-helix domain-containing protein [Aquincola sp. S2]|uniref:Helix-hairpin-helix domain-containing protein n=1 Tax=Pseudaquabacterium terrae TaxID=2732868 RepID=A0ABX2ER12_9BURK|nr:helix-hairpin-helix domain-containing protein [Aquabacterium terrae]NRF71076.1 helix-hairpin-helix domain-containing protein [Aquabacterium terrae]
MQRTIVRAVLAALVLAAGGALAAAPAARLPAAPALVDINSAGRAELKTLPGIGDAEAERIVAHRPYLTKADLVLTKALPAGVYLQIKGRVIARQKGKPRA